MKKFLVGAVLLLLLMLYFWQKDRSKINQNGLSPQPIAAMQEHETVKQQKIRQTTTDLIHFTVTKTARMLLLSGTFADHKQSKRFARNLRPTYSTTHMDVNTKLTDHGGIALAAKILPLFKKSYIEGEVRYDQGTLILKGTVRSQKVFDQMNTLLQNADIPLKNLTIIDTKAVFPSPVKRQIPNRKRKARHSKKNRHSVHTKNHAATNNKPMPAKQVMIKQQAQTSNQKTPQHVKQQKKMLTGNTINMATHTKAKNTPQITAKKSIRTLLKQHHIGFLPAKGTLTPQGEKTVDALAGILLHHPSIHVEIAGYTDSDGSESFNQKLSQKRVDTVKKRLVSKGISPKRLRAKGYGESHPLVPNTSDENKQKNRRVEITVLKLLKI